MPEDPLRARAAAALAALLGRNDEPDESLRTVVWDENPEELPAYDALLLAFQVVEFVIDQLPPGGVWAHRWSLRSRLRRHFSAEIAMRRPSGTIDVRFSPHTWMDGPYNGAEARAVRLIFNLLLEMIDRRLFSASHGYRQPEDSFEQRVERCEAAWFDSLERGVRQRYVMSHIDLLAARGDPTDAELRWLVAHTRNASTGGFLVPFEAPPEQWDEPRERFDKTLRAARRAVVAWGSKGGRAREKWDRVDAFLALFSLESGAKPKRERKVGYKHPLQKVWSRGK